MAEHVMLVVAQEGDESSPLVAGALNLVIPPILAADLAAFLPILHLQDVILKP